MRCTGDGLAKLLDVGAVAAIGPSRQLIGTAAFCAPEAIDLQALDERTDL